MAGSRKYTKMPKIPRTSTTMIFNVALLIKLLFVLFIYIWWHYQIHLDRFLDFSDPLIASLLWAMIGIQLASVFNFWFIQRTKGIGVLINATLLLVGLGAMFIADADIVVELDDRLVPIIAIVIADIMLGYIALQGLK